MDTRLIFSESRNMPVHAAVTLVLVMVPVLLAAGCLGEDYVPDHDLIVIKLASDGTLAWSQNINKEGDDKASILIPTSDGGAVIPENYFSLLRLSTNGETLWERNFMDSGCMVDSFIQLRDGSFLTGSSATGVICKIDMDGNLVWNQTVKNKESIIISPYSVIENSDGVILVAGNYIAQLDQEGRSTWQRSYVTEGHRIFSVIEMKKNGNLLGLSQKDDQLFLLKMDRNGTIIANSSLGKYNEDSLSRLYFTKYGYSMLFFNTTNSTMETMGIEPDGMIMQNNALLNATPSPWVLLQNPIIMTNDDGYASVIVRYPDSKTNSPAGGRKISIGITKMDADGAVIWTSTPVTFCKPENEINIQIKTVVQTSDEGFVILGLRDNFWKC